MKRKLSLSSPWLLLLVFTVWGCGRPTDPPTPQSQEPRSQTESATATVSSTLEAEIAAALEQQRRGNLPEALSLLQALATRYPSHGELFIHIAALQQALGQGQQAEHSLNIAIAVNPQHPQVYTQRGILLIEQGDPLRAVADFNQSLYLDPAQPQVHHHRGQAHLQRQDYQAALTDFDTAMRMDPSLRDPYLGKVDALEGLGRIPEAAETLSGFLRLTRGQIPDTEREMVFYRLVDMHRDPS